jgi:hypothetical protein
LQRKSTAGSCRIFTYPRRYFQPTAATSKARQRSSTIGLPPVRLPLVLANSGYVPAFRYPVARAAPSTIARAGRHDLSSVFSNHAARPAQLSTTKTKPTTNNRTASVRATQRFLATTPRIPSLSLLAVLTPATPRHYLQPRKPLALSSWQTCPRVNGQNG